MTEHERTQERARLAALAMRLLRMRGGEVSPDLLASEAHISRHRFDAIFEDENDLFDAIADLWYQPLIAMMEEVLASELPANRKLYEFIARRFVMLRDHYRQDPAYFRLLCDLGARRFERVRPYVDLADHYTCELIAQAQDEGFFEGLAIDQALSLINQMVVCYTMPDMLTMFEARLSEDKLGAIIDTLFAGLSAKSGGARGTSALRAA